MTLFLKCIQKEYGKFKKQQNLKMRIIIGINSESVEARKDWWFLRRDQK